MTDQTRWGIDQVQVRNKAVKYQKDLVSRAMEHVVKMDESGITDLMLLIEAEYERKYGENVAKKYKKTVLQIRMVLSRHMYMYGKKNKKKNKNYYRNNVILSLWSRSVGIYDFRVDSEVDTLCLR